MKTSNVQRRSCRPKKPLAGDLVLAVLLAIAPSACGSEGLGADPIASSEADIIVDCEPGPCSSGGACPPEACTSCSNPGLGVDEDQDGIPDRTEYLLAHKFFPGVYLQTHGPDLEEAYWYRNLSTPYQVVALTVPGTACGQSFQCLEIRFGIAFRYDHGDVVAELTDHLGDSEMYAAVVRRASSWSSARDDPDAWELVRDFTSAHLGTSFDGSRFGFYGFCTSVSSCQQTAYFPGAPPCAGEPENICTSRSWCSWDTVVLPCNEPSPRSTPPIIFSANKKHALYHTRQECDDGAAHFDECAHNNYNLRYYKGQRLQNVGSSGAANSMDRTMRHPDLCQVYDVWGNAKFGEATSYRSLFTRPLDWKLP